MEIRQISLDDLPSVYRLGKSAFIDEKNIESFVYGYWSLQQLAQMFEQYPDLMLVATDGDVIAGFVLGHPKYEGGVDIGYLEWVAVAKEYRGQGIAKKLVSSLLEVFRKNGEVKVVTDVKGINEASMKLFQDKFGFELKESVSFLVKDLTQELNSETDKLPK